MTTDRYDDRYLAGLLRDLRDEDVELEEPPPAVWAAIVAELGDEVGEPAPATGSVPASPEPGPSGPAPATAPVTSLEARRRRPGRPTGWALVAAAAVILGALVIVGTVAGRGRGSGGEVAAEATLTSEGLPNHNNLVGRAELVKVGDREEIDLDLPGLPGTDTAYYELWLIAPDGKRLQSLGITDGHGRYVVPTGIDPHQYPLVDVSREPPDGNPAHSGDSLVRGKLTV